VTAGIRNADAMVVATATEDARPSARFVLLKGFDRRGFAFYTNIESRKAGELAANRRAALVFYWDALGRQVRVEGSVENVSREESARYFDTRPRLSRLSAWVSRQSQVIGSRSTLEARLAELERMYPGDDVPLPPFWGGYRVSPDVIEFWEHRESRLHDRIRFTREADGWRVERLAP
jgi:pyridoxamine 5'-phosphate oxidase